MRLFGSAHQRLLALLVPRYSGIRSTRPIITPKLSLPLAFGEALVNGQSDFGYHSFLIRGG